VGEEELIIEIKDLHKYFKDLHVLRGITTAVAVGEVVAMNRNH
jgi:ABC-type polar amino acid transport system ATPase subunit